LLSQLMRSHAYRDAPKFGPFEPRQLKAAWFDVLLNGTKNRLKRAQLLLAMGADPLQRPPVSSTVHSTLLLLYSESGNILMRTVMRGRTNVAQADLLTLLIANRVDATEVASNDMTTLHALIMHPSADAVACANILLDA